MTTLKTIGTLPRNVSKVEGSGACRISRRRCIVSNTCSAVSPQPRSKPNPCNLHKRRTTSDIKLGVSGGVCECVVVCLSVYKLTHIQTQNRVSQMEV